MLNYAFIFFDTYTQTNNISENVYKILYQYVLKFYYPCCLNYKHINNSESNNSDSKLTDIEINTILRSDFDMIQSKINSIAELKNIKMFKLPRILYDLCHIL